ncbi:MAG: hypothetical protein HYT71_00665 [Candidatus Aenigmarchaeota archaeon]|nr:hypothetical protein [Candidatus Aenigmarchaeota archaeon]
MNKGNLIMAIFMGATMVISVLGFAFLQGSSTPAASEEKLPTTNIIDYALTQAQRQTLAVDQGKTLIDFVYDPQNCTNCGQLMQSLESLATQFNDQIVLSELKVSSADYIDLPRLFMASQIGSWSRKGSIQQQDVEAGFCSVVLYPPLGCAIKPQVNNTANNTK